MLEQVEWGEFKLWDLFEITTVKWLDEWKFNLFKNQKKDLIEFVGRTRANNWVKWYINKIEWIETNPKNVISISQIWTITAQIRTNERYGSQNIFMLTPNEHKELISLFCVWAINKVLSWTFSEWYSNYPTLDKLKNLIIELPIKYGKIDFNFMNKYISIIESEKHFEINDYLETTWLKNYRLTSDELKALKDFKEWKIERKEFKMGNLFERISTKKLPYKAKELSLIPTKESPLPCLTSSFMNQWLNYYAPKDNATVLKNVISIPSNSDVYRAYFQSNEFTVLSDAYAIRWKYFDTELFPAQYLFLVCCINQVTDLPIYSYKNKLGWWNVVKEKSILLPTNFYTPDLWFMNNFITAIEKILIKDVVTYNQERLKATDEIISEL